MGIVRRRCEDSGNAVIDNVPSYRTRKGVVGRVPGRTAAFTGDVAWGGNWFFLVNEHRRNDRVVERGPADRVHVGIRQALTANGHHRRRRCRDRPRRAIRTRRAMARIRGTSSSARGRPTTARLAAPAPARSLPAWPPTANSRKGEVWRQESIVGSVFEASYRRQGDRIIPSIRGSAYVNAESTLILDDQDPFEWGIPR